MTATLPPGPDWSVARQTLAWGLRPRPFLDRCHARYGDMFTINIGTEGPWVMLAHPDMVKQVFTGDPAVFHAGEANVILRPALGRHSVLLLDDAQHLRQRKLLLPPFHGERMQRYGALIEHVTNREMQRWPVGQTFALYPAMQRITFDVILQAVFGLHEGDELDRLRPLVRDLVDVTHNRAAMLPWMRREMGGRSPWGRFVATRRRTDEVLHQIIRARMSDPEVAQRDDVLSMLVQARDESGEAMTVEELRDELMTLLLAGHETTATSLAWCFQYLLRAPEEIGKLRDDGSRIDAVIKETMRIRPVVPVVARRLHAPLQVGAWTLPAGVMVAPNIELIHHRDDLYPQPDTFRPDRFVDSQAETYEWLPFGGGIRRCLGASFATFEMRTVIPVVLRRATSLRLADSAVDRVRRAAVVMVPERGVRVRLDRPLDP
jgi:cytochrome P450 family 135